MSTDTTLRTSLSHILVATLALILTAVTGVQAQSPSLLVDLNAGVDPSQPAGFVEITDANGDRVAIFAANSGSGRELHRTDGTAGGTSMIRDLNLGLEGSNPTELVVMNDVVYFRCRKDDVSLNSGEELCRSDGTRDGTYVLKDIRPGSIDSNLRGLTVVGNQLFFFASDGTTGLELWVSDGTESGTELVKDIYPGSTPLNRASSGFNISLTGRYAGTSDTFYFMANDGTTGLELWKSDGTPAGTELVKDIEPGSRGPQWLQQFTALGDVLVFESYTDDTGREPWVSNGTAAGTLSLDLGTDALGSEPTSLTRVGDDVYFFAGLDTATGFRYFLYRTDGGSPVQVAADVQPGGGDASIAPFGTKALLRIYDTSAFRSTTWVTDGTGGGTFELSSTIRPDFDDVRAGGTGFEGDVTPAVLGSDIYFQGDTQSGNGLELYRTNGTAGGTELVQEIGPGTDDARITDFFVYSGQTLLFGADDGTNGNELWSINGQPVASFPYVEDFETDGLGTRYTASFTFYDGVNDHFQRTDGSDISNITGPYTGFGGSFFFAGEDLDDNNGDGQAFKTLTLQPVDISRQTAVRVSGKFGAGCNEGVQFSCYDSDDSLVVRYSFDGGTSYTTGLQFSYVENITGQGQVDEFNEPWAQDLNFDGNGEGGELVPAMKTFGFDVQVPPTAQTITVQLEAHIDGAAEEFAFDDVSIGTNSVFVDAGLDDVTFPVNQQRVIDLRGVFRDAQGGPLTYSASVRNSAIATASTSSTLPQVTLSGVSEGSTLLDVTASNANGGATETILVTTTEPTPDFAMDVRVARAADFCSDTSDPTTCNVVGAYRFSNPRSDTLSNVNPGELVLVRYVLRNRTSDDLLSPSITDAERGMIVDAGSLVEGSDSLVVNKIYPAPTQPSLQTSVVTGSGETPGGVSGTRRDVYGIDVPAPEVRFDTRIARAAEFCSDTSDPSTCSVIGAWRFGSPRPDTLRNVNPGEPVLVRYIAVNRGSADLTSFTVTDSERGEVWNGPALDRNGNPEVTEPFDSLVVNKIYPAPSTPGLDLSRVDVTAQDAGGNTDEDARIYGIEIQTPEVALNTRIARAADFCSDTSDPSTCSTIGAWRFGSPRSDTLRNVNPGEPVLVRYIAVNRGSTDLTSFNVTDTERGQVWDGPALDRNGNPIVTQQFDSLVVNKIYPAPSTPGLDLSRVDVTAQDAGGNTDEDARLYGIEIQTPEVVLNTRIARASEFCSDTSDPSTCSVIGAWRFGSPRSDTLRNVNPGEPVLVRYIAVNRGSTDLTSFNVTDTERGQVWDGPALDRNGNPIVTQQFDSLVVNKIYSAPPATGLTVARADVAASDAGGNEDQGATVYGIDVPAPDVRLDTRIARADQFCSDTSDPSTCSTIGAWDNSGPRSDTLSNVNPGELVLVRYIAVNRGSTDLTSFTVTDSERGEVWNGPALDRNGNPEVTEPFDSLVVNKIYPAPSAAGLTVARADVAASDAGGNENRRATVYGIDVPKPKIRVNTRIGFAADFCSDTSDPSTCSTIGAWDGTGPRSDTLANAAAGDAVLVRYIVNNVGNTNLTSFTVNDADRGQIWNGPALDRDGNPKVTEPFDSLVVNRIYLAGSVPGVNTSRVTAVASDAGSNTATTPATTYGIQSRGPAFRIIVQVAPASLFCVDPNDVTTCSSAQLKRMAALAKSNPDGIRALLEKQGSEKEVVRYAFFNTGTVDFVRHTLTDNVAGVVFSDRAQTVAGLDSLETFRIYDEVAPIGDSREITWTTTTASGEVFAESTAEVPLPVELVGFDALVADRRVTLQWTTASEENNAGFEVQQYDPEADAWNSLTFVEGAGTTAEARAYRFDVGELEPNVHTFRLRQVDVSGRFAYSKRIEAIVGIDGPYRLTPPSPNPMRTSARFELTTAETQRVRVELYDLLGRRVATLLDEEMEANRPKKMTMHGGSLASGSYFLRVVGDGFSTTERITIVR